MTSPRCPVRHAATASLAPPGRVDGSTRAAPRLCGPSLAVPCACTALPEPPGNRWLPQCAAMEPLESAWARAAQQIERHGAASKEAEDALRVGHPAAPAAPTRLQRRSTLSCARLPGAHMQAVMAALQSVRASSPAALRPYSATAALRVLVPALASGSAAAADLEANLIFLQLPEDELAVPVAQGLMAALLRQVDSPGLHGAGQVPLALQQLLLGPGCQVQLHCLRTSPAAGTVEGSHNARRLVRVAVQGTRVAS